jgi:hypothetical protein
VAELYVAQPTKIIAEIIENAIAAALTTQSLMH